MFWQCFLVLLEAATAEFSETSNLLRPSPKPCPFARRSHPHPPNVQIGVPAMLSQVPFNRNPLKPLIKPVLHSRWCAPRLGR